jgi:hypothetical protein
LFESCSSESEFRNKKYDSGDKENNELLLIGDNIVNVQLKNVNTVYHQKK